MKDASDVENLAIQSLLRPSFGKGADSDDPIWLENVCDGAQAVVTGFEYRIKSQQQAVCRASGFFPKIP